MLFQIIPILQVLALAATPLVAGAPADAPLTTPAPSVAPAYPNMWFYNDDKCSGKASDFDLLAGPTYYTCQQLNQRVSFGIDSDPNPISTESAQKKGCILFFEDDSCTSPEDTTLLVKFEFGDKALCSAYSTEKDTYKSYKLALAGDCQNYENKKYITKTIDTTEFKPPS